MATITNKRHSYQQVSNWWRYLPLICQRLWVWMLLMTLYIRNFCFFQKSEHLTILMTTTDYLWLWSIVYCSTVGFMLDSASKYLALDWDSFLFLRHCQGTAKVKILMALIMASSQLRLQQRLRKASPKGWKLDEANTEWDALFIFHKVALLKRSINIKEWRDTRDQHQKDLQSQYHLSWFS